MLINVIEMISRELLSSDYFKSLEISLHAGCTVRCNFCPQDLYQDKYFSSNNAPRNMSISNFSLALNNLKGSAVEKLVFAGYSENFLNPNAIELIQMAVKKGFRVSVITTTIGLNIKDIDILSKLPIERVTISIKPNFNKNKVQRDNIWNNIDYAFKRLNSQAIIVAETKYRESYVMNELKSYCKTNNIDFRFDWHDRAGNLTRKPLIFNENILSSYYCTRPLTNLLQPNGDVSLCCMDWSLKHIIGNLFSDNYTNILNDKKINTLLNSLHSGQIDNQICKNCHYVEKVGENWKPITIRRKEQYETHK